MRIDVLTPVVAAAPGERVAVRVRVTNDAPGPRRYRLRVVGWDEPLVEAAAPVAPLAPAAADDLDVVLAVPLAFAAGRHAVAVEARSDDPTEAPALAGFTLAVGTLDHVGVTIVPSTIRGRRRGRFAVVVRNHQLGPVDLDLGGEGHGLRVRLARPRVVVAPGEEVRLRGKVRGPRNIFGETVQHIVTVVARSRSAPSYASATFRQRPLIPRPLRGAVAVLTALALWAGLLGWGAWWWTNRDKANNAEAAKPVDVNGDGIPDTIGVDLDGDGIPDVDVNGDGIPDRDLDGDGIPDVDADRNGVPDKDLDGDGKPDADRDGDGIPDDRDPDGGTGTGNRAARPTITLIGGTVHAGESGEDDGVTVTLAPLALGAPAPAAATVVGGPGEAAKLWPARYGRYTPLGALSARQTSSVSSVATGGDGAWVFADVPLHQTYEVHFGKPGFDSKSYVITPTDDGQPVDLDVSLDPARGALGGVVVGPGGPRGGVDVVVTDGLLTFSTTTSTDAASRGRFSIGGVSTPGTYTLTASDEGVSTEVLQVTLDPGQARTDLRIEMAEGLGSISGRITARGAPLSGATVTASGAFTRTTTSLSEGDRGSFAFPRLPLGGEYTVTVAHDGYVTQSRRIALAGNASGVNFDLVATTATVTGVVVSDQLGPLPGAAITIERDKLSFRSGSAAAPDAGAFTVGDLPPGTYLITFTRYDHRTASQLVTLQAGEVRDLGQVVLTFTGAPEIPETGRLIVRVLDSEAAELTGATVTLADIDDPTTILRTLSDTAGTQSTFAFDSLPVGTYTVRVSRPAYRTATRRVSVGLGQESVEFRLLRLGQATGRLIDSLTRQQLTDYEVTVFRIEADGTETALPAISVPPNAQPNADGEILWETPPASLVTGLYRVAVTRPPPGYGVVEDQVLDNNLPPDLPVRTMRFAVRPDEEAPVRLNDVEADPYPVLSGRIFVPTNDSGTVAPINAPIAVTLTCPGGLKSDVPADVLVDEVPPDGIDGYRFEPTTLQAQRLLGDCVLTVAATGYVTAQVPLPRPLTISDGFTRSDQIVNVALVPPSEAIRGSVFWRDFGRNGAQVAAPGVNVATDGDRIIGFSPTQGNDPNQPPTAIHTGVPATTTTGANGEWRLDGHVLGTTTYVFSDPTRFVDRRFSITIDQNGVRTIGGVVSTGSIDVELNALPGRIEVPTHILTVDPAPAPLVASQLTATGPAPATVTVCPPPDPGFPNCSPRDPRFVINQAAAGTWQLAVAPPPNHILAPGNPTNFSAFVDPNATVVTDPIAFIELGRIDVTVVDQTTNQPVTTVTPQVTIQQVPRPTGPLPGDPNFPGRSEPVNGNGQVSFSGIPVNTVGPVGPSVVYAVRVQAAGYDTSQAVFTITGGAPGSAGGTGAAGVVGVLAGSKPQVRVALPAFGSLKARAIGRIGTDASAPTEPLPTSPPATVTATRLYDNFGTPVAPTTTNPPIAADGTFTVSGLPGYYTIQVTHPYFDGLVAQPPYDVPQLSLYRIQNNQNRDLTAQPFVLAIKPGILDLTVVTSATGGSAVVLADVQVLTTGPNPVIVRQGNTGPDGKLRLTGITPGSYTLTIRNRDANGIDLNYPVEVPIAIPRGDTDAQRTTTVVAPSPEVGRSITGIVGARNSEGDLIARPATITVTRTYDQPQIDVNGNLTPNAADENDLNPAPAPSVTANPATLPAPPEAEAVFAFTNLAAGIHHLTFSDDPAYTAPKSNPDPVPVGLLPVTLTRVDYTAKDVTLTVNVTEVGGGPLPGATVTLVSPDNETLTPVTSTGGSYTFAPVAPELVAYRLSVSEPLHASLLDQAVTISPDPDGALAVPVALAANRSTITGLARKQATEGAAPTPMVNEGTVHLYLLPSISGPVGQEVAPPATPDGNGRYSFTINRSGQFLVRVELPGYATGEAVVSGVVLGETRTVPPIDLVAAGTVVITANGPPADDASLAVVVTQPAGTSITPQRTGRVFTFANLDPRLSYRFEARATGFVPAAVTVDLQVGETRPETLTLVERALQVTVTPVADGTGATVQLQFGADPPRPPTSTAANVYTFGRLPTGAATVTVSKAGYRTQTANVTMGDGTQPQTLSVTMHPDVTVTGTVTKGGADVEAATVTATRTGGGTAGPVPTGTDGAYSLPGLGIGQWTITAEKLGAGTATTTVDVTATSADTVSHDFALSPRSINVVFTVTGVTTATVTLDGQAPRDTVNGTITFSVLEDTALDWTVTSPTGITQSGTATVATPTVNVNVTMVARPTVTGTVTNADGSSASVTVYLCPSTGSCTSTTSAADGTFSVRPDVGTSTIRAGSDTATGAAAAQVTVTSGGVATPTSVTLTLPAPPTTP